MRVLYLLSDYVSHRRAGEANRRALALAGNELVDEPSRAEVAVVHDEPVYFHTHRAALAGLAPGVPVAAYCVVETDPAPPDFIAPLQGVDAVWTCSAFSAGLLSRGLLSQGLGEGGPPVSVAPHVVARERFSRDDLVRVRRLLGDGPGEPPHTFYTICDGANPRKNLPGLLRAYAALRGMRLRARPDGRAPCRPSCRLVVKQYRHALDLSGLPGVVSLTSEFTDGEMAALHALGDCYVSAHRAEAWGLGMSEAMAFGRPVVATGYSGCLDFLDSSTAWLVPFRLEAISQDELVRCPPFFTPGMRWAVADEDALARAMAEVLEHPEEARERGARGAVRARDFAAAKVGRLLSQLLSQLLARHCSQPASRSPAN